MPASQIDDNPIPVRASERVARRGVVPFHFRQAAASLRTNPVLYPYAKTAELKVCAVRIEPVRPPD